MLPDVVFVGPTKCGTTWIDAYLRSRPEVVLPAQTKETFFFDKAFARGLGWYAAQFPAPPQPVAGSGPQRRPLCVEVAPSLFHKPAAARALAETLPQARVVVVLRVPFERAVSHYFHYRKAGEARRSLAAMAARFPDVIEASLFGRHARMWEELLPGRVHYLHYAQLRADPAGFCAALCAVLDLPFTAPLAALSGRAVNAASVPRSAWAAWLGWRAAETLRRFGAHEVVNRLRRTRLKRLLFAGGGDIGAEREAIGREARRLAPIQADQAEFAALLAAQVAAQEGGPEGGQGTGRPVLRAQSLS